MQLQTNKQTDRRTERRREGARGRGKASGKRMPFAYPDTSYRASPSFFSMSPCSRPFSSALRVYSSFGCLPLSLSPLLSVSVCRLVWLDIFPLISVAIQLNLACLIYLINFFSPSTLPQSFFFSLSISFYFTLFMFFFLFPPPLSPFPSPSALKKCPPQRGRNRFGIFILAVLDASQRLSLQFSLCISG